MADRRRINGPPAGTVHPVFASPAEPSKFQQPIRTRETNEIRKICKISQSTYLEISRSLFDNGVVLKTGLTPSASGSAYLELEPSAAPLTDPSLAHPATSLKLSCTVHGPRPLPRSAAFSPRLTLSTHLKFAPFASRRRRAYVRDPSERDLAVHLETALKGIILSERWPKSGLDVVITVLEDEGDVIEAQNGGFGELEPSVGWGAMSVLSGCITAASAAIADAGIDCVDLVTGGVAAMVDPSSRKSHSPPYPITSTPTLTDKRSIILQDICPWEHKEIFAMCVVGYLPSRDEITELWIRGNAGHPATAGYEGQTQVDALINQAIEAAISASLVLKEAVKVSTESRLLNGKTERI